MPTTAPKTASYGAWKSPITSDLIVAQAITLSEVRLDDGAIYWLEGRPQERGRSVVVRAGGGGADVDVTPVPFNVRTRVHEYGGGAWFVDKGVLYFSNFADGRLYRLEAGGVEPQPLTPEPSGQSGGWRFADGIIDGSRNRWIGVREDHTAGGEPVNAIVAVDLAGRGGEPGNILVGGHDFFSSPRLSPDGHRLIWLAWDHPNMPWNGTTLYLAELDDAGAVSGEPEIIAGGPDESIFQPEWSPDGNAVLFVSDRSDWWNLYRFELATLASRPILPMAVEFGAPQWVFGMSTYAFAGPDRIVCTYSEAGLWRLGVVDLAADTLRTLETPFTQFASVRADGERVVAIAGAPSLPASVVEFDLRTSRHRILKKATDILDQTDLGIADYLSSVEAVEFPTTGGNTAFGLYYGPRNPDYKGPASEKPPLLVKVHGGPTSAASSTLNLGIHYWTSRGIAVLDVNYGGSTGFGRAYRDRLRRNWGVVDVDDCVNGGRFLIERGLVDPKRMVITGGSAGGYTTLAALAFRDFFQGGASHYGVSDAAALARDTHKFESRYMDWLIGAYPEEEELYRERSPLFHAERLSKPVIFFQGDEDAVVPPNQTEAMVDALRSRGTPVGYLLFSGEQHGFRQAANIKRTLDAELYFYAIEVFGTGLTF
ncbi:S9 family peptidase [Allomesorhizobium camelthorni]|uniref:S9 family peptidase n=1 Tax=Allomesorhizobium camelthorni TaxID=475069 RepID=A0A6G4WJN7_9HYPH|nr:S9 family peptidase [Mesorhizobium camelthorni]NGO54819.1 S9 family peptidase [Mesorhizobium camelthorni]